MEGGGAPRGISKGGRVEGGNSLGEETKERFCWWSEKTPNVIELEGKQAFSRKSHACPVKEKGTLRANCGGGGTRGRKQSPVFW